MENQYKHAPDTVAAYQFGDDPARTGISQTAAAVFVACRCVYLYRTARFRFATAASICRLFLIVYAVCQYRRKCMRFGAVFNSAHINDEQFLVDFTRVYCYN